MRPIAILPVSNWGGLEVLDVTSKDDETAIVCRWNFGYEKPQRATVNRVFYTRKDRAYIRKNGQRLYLDQMLRV